MLSVSSCTAAMAGSYYEKDNYYTRDLAGEDVWQGKLCEAAGIEEFQSVQAEQFQTMLEHSGNKCAAFDLTFSAPKSVSIAAELTQELKQDMLKAHHEAVLETLKDIEAKEIGARVTQNKETKWMHTGEMAVAKFDHTVSREGDMQLHTHAVVLNMTEYQGKAYALDGHRFFTNQMLYGQEYRNLLAEKLQTMGYKVEVTDPEKGLFELSAIREDVRQYFSKRRAQIEAEMNKNGETGAKAAQKAALKTRKVKDHVDMEAKRAEWAKELADLKQVLPIKQPDAAARMIEAEKAAAFDRAIARLSENSFAWTSTEVKQAVMAEGCITGIKQEDADRMISRSPLVKLQPKTKAGLPAGVYYTTRENIRIERKIVEHVALNKGKMKGISVEDAAKTLAAVSQANAWELGQEQKNVVEHIASSKDRFIAVRGLAGTGKTFTLNAAREVLEAHGYQVKGMSATGQAADELSKDANIKECSTIHHALNAIERKAGNSIPGEDYAAKSTWNFDGIKASGKPTVWFVDEASLTDNKLFYSTMKMATATGDKVVFIGDDRQMPPVGAGNAYANLVQSGKISMTELSDIRRQKDAPELLKAVVEAVKGESKVSLDIISKDIVEVPTRIKRLNAVVKSYTDLSAAEQAKTMVLTARNADRTEINNRIRKQLVKQGQLEQGKAFTVQYGKDKTLQERDFSKGDKVVFLQNDNKLGVKNGTKGNITKMDGNSIVVDIGENKNITVDMGKYNHIDHAYCVTPHKGQGATVKRAIIHMSSKDMQLNSKNAHYVDISRAKQEVKMFCDDRKKLDPQIARFMHKITSQDFKKELKKMHGMQGRKRQQFLLLGKAMELKTAYIVSPNSKYIKALSENRTIKVMNLAQKTLALVRRPIRILEKTIGGIKVK